MSGLIIPLNIDQLLNENKELQFRMKETEETLNAIRNGVDAIIIQINPT